MSILKEKNEMIKVHHKSSTCGVWRTPKDKKTQQGTIEYLAVRQCFEIVHFEKLSIP